MADLVSSGLEMIQGRLRRGSIGIEVDHEDGAPRILCVPSQIGQVVLNLLINATQAVEARGKDQGGLIQVSTRQEGDFGVLTVADNGAGIDPDHLPHLFDPFFTTKPVGEGTGLGAVYITLNVTVHRNIYTLIHWFGSFWIRGPVFMGLGAAVA